MTTHSDKAIRQRMRERGIPASKIDVTSFFNAAVTLFAEQNGMSGVVYRGESADSLAGRICDQCEAVLYEHPETLLLTFDLIRADYDIPSLPELDEEIIEPVEVGAVFQGHSDPVTCQRRRPPCLSGQRLRRDLTLSQM